jgi:hypothetical protein
MSPPVPSYFGGMILSDMQTAYNYEHWLVSMLQYRYEKYKKNWGFFMAMEALIKDRDYTVDDFHPIPTDPVLFIPGNLMHWRFLALKRRKLAILKFEVMKYYRRKGIYPML